MPQIILTGSDLIAIISVISTLIISVYANIIGKHFDIDKIKYEEKRSAYFEFCRSMSEFMYPDDIQSRNFLSINDAYLKVALCASPPALNAAKKLLDASVKYAYTMTALENNQQKIDAFRKSAEYKELADKMRESQRATMEEFRKDLASRKNFR